MRIEVEGADFFVKNKQRFVCAALLLTGLGSIGLLLGNGITMTDEKGEGSRIDAGFTESGFRLRFSTRRTGMLPKPCGDQRRSTNTLFDQTDYAAYISQTGYEERVQKFTVEAQKGQECQPVPW